MSQDKPDMDEVVRQVKEALGNATAGPWADNVFEPYTTVYSYDHLTEEPDGIIAKCEYEPDAHLISNAPDWLRLLIEEREQGKALLDQQQTDLSIVYEAFDALKAKVAERDEEIQRYKATLERVLEIAQESMTAKYRPVNTEELICKVVRHAFNQS